MMKITTLLKANLLILTLLVSIPSPADEVSFAAPQQTTDEVPRMWRVVNTEENGLQTTFYFLAITHAGLPLEYDGYLKRTVIPAFMSADDFWAEGIGSSSDPFKLKNCDTPITDPSDLKEIERTRRYEEVHYVDFMKKINQTLIKHHLPKAYSFTSIGMKRFSKWYIDHLSEFGVVRNLSLIESLLSKDTNSHDHPEKGGIVEYFLKLRPDVNRINLDRGVAEDDRYCSLGADRIKMFHILKLNAMAINQHIQKRIDTSKPILEMNDDLKRRVFNIDKPSSSDLFSTFPKELVKTYMCDRNDEWIRELSHIHDGQIHFVAVGVAHLSPSLTPSTSCDGLLGDLRALGLKPDLVS